MSLLNDQHAQRIVRTMAADKSAVLADVNEVSGRVATVEQALASGGSFPLFYPKIDSVVTGRSSENLSLPNYYLGSSSSSQNSSTTVNMYDIPLFPSDELFATDASNSTLILIEGAFKSGKVTIPTLTYIADDSKVKYKLSYKLSLFLNNKSEMKSFASKSGGTATSSSEATCGGSTVDLAGLTFRVLTDNLRSNLDVKAVFTANISTTGSGGWCGADWVGSYTASWTDMAYECSVMFLGQKQTITNNIQVPQSS